LALTRTRTRGENISELGKLLAEVLVFSVCRDCFRVCYRLPADGADVGQTGGIAALSHRRRQASAVRRRLDQAYLDKLDGKISEDFWSQKSAEWTTEEQQISLAIQGLAQAHPDRIIDAVRIFELANKAHFLYVSQPMLEKAKLLRMVL
jgi:hypothetical protein